MEIENNEDILALIARSVDGLADSSEVKMLNKWLSDSSENKQYFEQVMNIWEASDKKTDIKKISTAIPDKILEKVLESLPGVSPLRNFWFYWQKIAAVLLIPLIFGTLLWVYLNSVNTEISNEVVYNEIYTGFGTRSTLILADSTKVWLNSGSSLRYPNKFTDNNRTVFLKGEGYFEVESDVSRPFIVQTSTLRVESTGTKFDVFEYDTYSADAEVTLVTGKISVSRITSLQTELVTVMEPGQHLKYNPVTGINNLTVVDPYAIIAWKEGKLIFHDAPLSEVIKKIALVFNVDIELKGNELKEYSYHARFEDESLEEILKLLKLSAPLDYLEVPRYSLPDGSFSKKKVIIFSKI